jgi:hypothetical protein
MYVIVQHTVRDYDAWKPVFDEHESIRTKYGAKGHIGDPLWSARTGLHFASPLWQC